MCSNQCSSHFSAVHFPLPAVRALPLSRSRSSARTARMTSPSVLRSTCRRSGLPSSFAHGHAAVPSPVFAEVVGGCAVGCAGAFCSFAWHFCGAFLGWFWGMAAPCSVWVCGERNRSRGFRHVVTNARRQGSVTGWGGTRRGRPGWCSRAGYAPRSGDAPWPGSGGRGISWRVHAAACCSCAAHFSSAVAGMRRSLPTRTDVTSPDFNSAYMRVRLIEGRAAASTVSSTRGPSWSVVWVAMSCPPMVVRPG